MFYVIYSIIIPAFALIYLLVVLWDVTSAAKPFRALAGLIDDCASSQHCWIPQRPISADEKAMARAGLRQLVDQHQAAANSLSTLITTLMLKVIVSVGVIYTYVFRLLSYGVAWLGEAVLVVVLIGALALSCYVEKLVCKEWELRLRVAYHVVEMREILMERAEAIAKVPQSLLSRAARAFTVVAERRRTSGAVQ